MPPAATLAAKLKLKANLRAAVWHAPEGYLDELGPLPEGVTIATHLRGQFDWVQVFVKTQDEINALAPKAVAALRPTGLLWISFPKSSSKLQTDLTRDKGWEALHPFDLLWVNLVSVNDTWSAFAMRPLKPGETRQPWR